MFPAHQFVAAAATALLLVSGANALSAAESKAKRPSASCEDSAGLAVLASPVMPWKGSALRVVVTAEEQFDGELSLIAPDGSVAASSRERHGGLPYFWFAEVAAPAAGAWHAKLTRDGASR